MEDNFLRIRTYKEFWRVELSITNIEGHQLPVAITTKKLFYFVVTALLLSLIVKIPGIHLIRRMGFFKNPVIFYTLIPTAATYYLNRKRIDGKQPYIYLVDMVVFLFSPKRYEFFKPVKLPKTLTIKETIRFRVEEVVSIFEFKEDKAFKKKHRLFYKYK